jgi:hypothetical protein
MERAMEARSLSRARITGAGLPLLSGLALSPRSSHAQENRSFGRSPVYGIIAPVGLLARFTRYRFDYTLPTGEERTIMDGDSGNVGVGLLAITFGAWLGEDFGLGVQGELLSLFPVVSSQGGEYGLQPFALLGANAQLAAVWYPRAREPWNLQAGVGCGKLSPIQSYEDEGIMLGGVPLNRDAPSLPGIVGHLGSNLTSSARGGLGPGFILRVDMGYFKNDGWSVTTIGPSVFYRFTID